MAPHTEVIQKNITEEVMEDTELHGGTWGSS